MSEATLKEIAAAVAKDVLGFGWTSMTEPLPEVTAHAESAILAVLREARGEESGCAFRVGVEAAAKRCEDWSHRCPDCGAPVCSHVVLTARRAERAGAQSAEAWLRDHGAVLQADRLCANLPALAPPSTTRACFCPARRRGHHLSTCVLRRAKEPARLRGGAR